MGHYFMGQHKAVCPLALWFIYLYRFIIDFKSNLFYFAFFCCQLTFFHFLLQRLTLEKRWFDFRRAHTIRKRVITRRKQILFFIESFLWKRKRIAAFPYASLLCLTCSSIQNWLKWKFEFSFMIKPEQDYSLRRHLQLNPPKKEGNNSQ